MNEAKNKVGLYVSHLMVTFPADQRSESVESFASTVHKYRDDERQIIVGATFGHESDALVMIVAKTPDQVLEVEQAIKATNTYVVDSFLSLTELSEYTTSESEEQARVGALDVADDEKQKMMSAWRERMEIYERHRLYPQLPSKQFLCFYPMSKKREHEANWYSLDFEQRAEYMRNHGTVGRNYAGRIVQLITGATGLTDWEWGVSLFSDSLVDIKDIVYEMRFDEASAIYGEFGHFTIAQLCEPEKIFG